MYHTLPSLLLLLALTLFFPSSSSSSSSPPQPRFPSKDGYDAKPVPPHSLIIRTCCSKNSTNDSVNSGQRPLRLRRFLSPRQTTPSGRCGAGYANQVCSNNQCCSSFGYCGTEFEYCGDIVGCQPLFGRCGNGPVSSTVAPTPTFIFTFTFTSTPTSTLLYSSTLVSMSMSMSVSVSVSASLSSSMTMTSAPSPLPSATLIPSTNGQCGNVTTCAGSIFGTCCSEYYFCGQGLAFCGEGCRVGFGVCNGGGGGPGFSSSVSFFTSSLSMFSSSTFIPLSSSTTQTPTPTPTPTDVSTAGRCGADGNGQTCTGSRFGRCCSSYGWCGDGADDYCKVLWGCQVEFGVCTS